MRHSLNCTKLRGIASQTCPVTDRVSFILNTDLDNRYIDFVSAENGLIVLELL